MDEGRAYIESGILELYVLGQLTAGEQSEVQAMAERYPEVKQEIAAIERAMEQYAVAQAVQPPADLDKKILARIRSEQTGPVTTEMGPAGQDAVIVPLNADYEARIRNLRIALVACLALLAVSTIALFSAHSQLGSAKNQIAELSQDKEKFTSTVNFMKQTNAELQKIADMTTDPNWKFVKLSGTPMDPKANMMVYWHTTGKHVIMDNRKMNLPATDKDHQYQLWALVNGKPVDLGVFDVNTASPQILVSMKDIASAQTFAVTLEKRGGSPVPTLTRMIVAGNVSI